jgi:hypothetical protein
LVNGPGSRTPPWSGKDGMSLFYRLVSPLESIRNEEEK